MFNLKIFTIKSYIYSITNFTSNIKIILILLMLLAQNIHYLPLFFFENRSGFINIYINIRNK